MDILNMIPRRFYSVEGNEILLANFTANVNISEQTKDQTSLFIDYRVKSNETPMQIADRLYDDPSLYWTIHIVNNILNSVEDWPRKNFDNYIRTIYSEEELSEIVTYADSDRNRVDLMGLRFQNGFSDTTPTDAEIITLFSLKAISRYDILLMEQEQKRNIRLIDPDYVEVFADSVKDALNE